MSSNGSKATSVDAAAVDPKTAMATGLDQLHRAVLHLMLSSEDQQALTTSGDEVAGQIHNLISKTALDVPVRFAVMRALFVLGANLPANDASRTGLLSFIDDHKLGELPPWPPEDPLRLSLRNNHLLMQSAMLTVWPEIEDHAPTAKVLVERFVSQITPSGMFPSELCRGASCLWYSNLAVMLLTAIAFYSDRTGDRLVCNDLLVRAIQGLEAALPYPPSVRQYARRNQYSHPDHGRDPSQPDVRFLAGYHRSRHYMAWIPLANHLLDRATFALHISDDDVLPICSDYIGGRVENALGTEAQ